MEFVLDGYSLLRFCGVSALLLVMYYCLYDRKASFVHCRWFLLLSIPFAFVLSVLEVPVYDSGREIILCPLPPVETAGGVAGEERFPWVEETVAFAGGGGEEAMQEMPAAMEEDGGGLEKGMALWEQWGMWDFVFWVYGIGACFLLLRWIFAVIGILRLKKYGSCYAWEGMEVVKNNRVTSPFSFFRMIFIHRKLEGETLRVVLSHERSHIEHKHDRDTLVMEMYCIFFWFNPFVWMVKKELKALHEFEVDRCLLDEGLELSKYQNIIFNELMGYGPAIANGFHNSMVKKRFIMMKTKNCIRYGLLRKIVLLPVMACLVILFAFTDKEVVRERFLLPSVEEMDLDEMPRVEEVFFDESVAEVAEKDAPELAPVLSEQHVPLVDDTLKASVPDSVAAKGNAPFKGREGFTFYPLSEEQVVVSLAHFGHREKIKYIVTDENETRVTILVPVYYDSHWVQFNKGFCMVDEMTGDIYMLRSMTRGIELNKTYVVQGKKSRMVEFTMVFPPLKKEVKVVTFCQKYPEMGAPTPSNGSNSYFKNVRIADYLPPKDLDRYYDKEGRPKVERKMEYVVLREDQLVISALPFSGRTQISSIVTDENETRLTVAVPIHYESNWVQFNKGFCIEDCRTGDVYKILGVDRGIELNKTLIVKNKKMKMVEFTMIFPPLGKRVKRVNIYLKYPEESGLAPTNSNGEWDWRGVRLADYQKKPVQIYY